MSQFCLCTNAVLILCLCWISGNVLSQDSVIHRLQDGSILFNRNWTEYKTGFGFPSQEFWIGNDKLSFLTNQNTYELRMDVTSVDGLSLFVTYKKFRISDENSEYKLTSVGEYKGEDNITAFVCPSDRVIQCRVNGSQPFFLLWSDYKTGFGTPMHELWLGNDKLHSLTTQKDYELRVDIVNSMGNPYYAKYISFSVSDESDNYRLSLGNYSEGDAGDGLSHSGGKYFTTQDRDNDNWGGGNCATKYADPSCSPRCHNNGAWWYAGNTVVRMYFVAPPPSPVIVGKCIPYQTQEIF
ncbi:Ficolin-1 [Holothuria leucospilota]|uniref:Ficolin-1 n=1 Tax=Holothuria leucospilota TaxID=206669 RepID=A0A9Q1BWQ6_HOLLE|nr:Ficolin-1 [Holothuria leucospilota]